MYKYYIELKKENQQEKSNSFEKKSIVQKLSQHLNNDSDKKIK